MTTTNTSCANCRITTKADSRHNAGTRRVALCQLHAAAPTLLAALQDIRAALAHAHAWKPTMPRHLIQEIADTALTQADGRTP